MRLHTRAGFSIIELLVVIAIIGILAGLLMPAIQYSREAARVTHCSNNLKQLGLACQAHVDQRGFFPTGGWGWRWAGDPDRGYGKDQPGGWLYNILPFIDLETLHEMGKGGTNQTEGRIRASKVVSTFCCPSRRDAIPYQYEHDYPYFNIDLPNEMGRSDYAACGGDMNIVEWPWEGPATLEAGAALSEADWADSAGPTPTGVIFTRSRVEPPHITDGTSTTYLMGEKYLRPDAYTTGKEDGDDQGWDVGYDWDTVRWTYLPPLRDTFGAPKDRIFGSAHPGRFHMVFCDGSAQTINYLIDPLVHRQMGTRAGNEIVDPGAF